MLFVELRFFFLFAVAFCVHWALGSHKYRKLWLLLVSYVVYGAWDWRYLLLIWTSTVLDWFAGQGAAEGGKHRKAWLMASLIGNLGLLGFFKYYNFFVSSASDLLKWLGLPASDYTLNIILPVGISFYTFQTLSYTIDIYRGRLKPTDKFSDLALFVAFFPQLVAGPIVRADRTSSRSSSTSATSRSTWTCSSRSRSSSSASSRRPACRTSSRR